MSTIEKDPKKQFLKLHIMLAVQYVVYKDMHHQNVSHLCF